MKTTLRHWISLGALTAVVAACGGGGGTGGTGSAMGTLRMSITDAPACGYDEVNVTIEKVRVHQSAAAADGDAGWSEVVLTPAKRVDLLTLTNGVLEDLGQTALPAGRYTQMRLVLAANGNAAPYANSVVPTGGAETPLDTPSGQQSGLKMNVDVDVPADKVVDVALDFDACKSIVKRGNSGQYNLKPVISVIPMLSDAGQRIVGWIAPAIAASAPSVSAQQAGVAVKATIPDPVTGRFVLYPVPAGDYDIVISGAGRATAVMTGVPVTTTAYTYTNSEQLPMAPAAAASAPREVTGTVTPATATVRALQSLTAGPTVEVATAAVDALSGAFTFSLPVDAPQKTAWVAPDAANPLAVSFDADADAAGLYTLEASSADVVKTQDIDTNAPVPAVAFTFP